MKLVTTLLEYLETTKSVSPEELIAELSSDEQAALKEQLLMDFDAVAMSDEAFALQHVYRTNDAYIPIFQTYSLEQLLETLRDYYQTNWARVS